MAELARETGVSNDVLKKLKTGHSASTTVENAVLIAAYYGKSVNDFLMCREVDEAAQAAALFDMLTPEERRLLAAQIRGLVLHRDKQSG